MENSGIFSILAGVPLLIMRYLLPVCVVMLIILCIPSMIKRRKTAPIAAISVAGVQGLFNIYSYESSIGRSRICDIRINVPTVSRRHAVLSFSEKYGFKIYNISNSEIYINDILVDGYAYLQRGDVITLGGMKMTIVPTNDVVYDKNAVKSRDITKMMLLTFCELIIFAQLFIHYKTEHIMPLCVTFGGIILIEWIYYFIFRRRGDIEIEIFGFLLTSFGFAVAASAYPDTLIKQFVAFLLGIFGYIAANIILKNIEFAVKMRYVFTVLTILVFVLNLIIGKNINGAKNWIAIGQFTVQPSEILKFTFIFVGASTLDRIMAKRNLVLFIAFSAASIGALALMRDFGTASIYFITTLIIMFMRSGDIKIITGVTAVTGLASAGVVMFVPYVQRRFSSYRRAWEYASDRGYQQTRTMIAIASGGLFGLGGGNGHLDDVAAADTDLVFGMLAEEWGLIIAMCLVLCFVVFAVYTFRRIPTASSSFYAIAAAAASGLFIFQISLNIFGSTDLLPLTGVTMPFISNGGSSMIASWLLLSFIKSVGQCTNALALTPVSTASSRGDNGYYEYDGETNEESYIINNDDFEDISSNSLR